VSKNVRGIGLGNIKFMGLVLLNLFLSIAPGAAKTFDANQAGKDFATGLGTKMNEIKNSIKAENIPGFKGEEVDAKKLYNSGARLEEEAGVLSKDNEYTGYLQAAKKSRPAFKIDPEQDPLFKRTHEIEEMSHALSATYSGCKQIPVGNENITKFKEKTCLENGSRDRINFKCKKDLVVTCTNTINGLELPLSISDFLVTGSPLTIASNGFNITLGSLQNFRNGNCADFNNQINFNIKELEEINEFIITGVRYDDFLAIAINGHNILNDINANRRVVGGRMFGNCERRIMHDHAPIDMRPWLKSGSNILSLQNIVSGSGTVWINIKATKKNHCNEQDNINYRCDGARNRLSAQLEGSQCSDASGVKYVQGPPVKRDCWQWDETYSELGMPIYNKEPLCQELMVQGCGQIASKCSDGPTSSNDFCKQRILSFSCPFQVPARTVSLCGDQLICPNGECTKEYQDYKPATEDFKKSATALEVAKEISSFAKSDNFSIFKGTSKSCKKHQLNIKDCCSDKGWGMDLGLTKCSPEEIELGMSKEANRVHYINEYESGGLLDKRSYKVYCVYPSKLARIIIEQGKIQQSKSFGSAHNPDCSGFTLDELQVLDFEQMNFSEFYDDVMKKAENNQIPDINELARKIKDSLSQKFPRKERSLR
jgi:conjugal transfer mating pair stabilization protein TraN